MGKYSKASNLHRQAAMNLHELTLHGKEAYLVAKKKNLIDKKRELLNLVFDSLTLDEGKLHYQYTKASHVIATLHEASNRSKTADLAQILKKIFEPQKLHKLQIKGASFGSNCTV